MGTTTRRGVSLTTVGDVMTPDPLAIPEDLSAREAARLLEFYRVSGAPVVDDVGEVIGVLSQSDLIHALATAPLQDAWSAFLARDLMSTPAVTVGDGVLVEQAARLMEAHRIHRLIVLGDGGRVPVGIVTASDLVREMAGWDD
jgi:CBS domain-containing protein